MFLVTETTCQLKDYKQHTGSFRPIEKGHFPPDDDLSFNHSGRRFSSRQRTVCFLYIQLAQLSSLFEAALQPIINAVLSGWIGGATVRSLFKDVDSWETKT